jgi:hypothetical protein
MKPRRNSTTKSTKGTKWKKKNWTSSFVFFVPFVVNYSLFVVINIYVLYLFEGGSI